MTSAEATRPSPDPSSHGRPARLTQVFRSVRRCRPMKLASSSTSVSILGSRSPRLKAAAAVSMVVCLIALMGGTATATTRTAPGHDLYLAQAAGGTLSGSKLVLHGVVPRVATFTDRPRRAAGSIEARDLVADWDRTFRGDPPNAALEVEGAPPGRDVAILELRNPRVDHRHGTLTFTVRQLRRTGDPALDSFDRRADPGRIHRFGRATLFIDAGSVAPTVVRLKVSVAAGQSASVEFDAPVVPTGSTIAGIVTPPLGGPAPGNSVGGIKIKEGSLSFTATAPGGGMLAETVLLLEVPREAKVAGVAVVPEGSSVELTVGGEPGETLTGGPFEAGG